MKSLLVFLLALSFTAGAEVFKAEDSQYEHKTYVTVTRPWSNAFADEHLMGQIIREAHSALLLELYKLNASNQIPEQLLNADDVQRFNMRKSDMNKFVTKVNASIAAIRDQQTITPGMVAGDWLPDAIFLYYPLLKSALPSNLSALQTVAVVATVLKEKTYLVSQDASCKDLTQDQIREQLAKKDANEVSGCKVTLTKETQHFDYKFFWMVGIDKQFLNGGGSSPKSAGIGFIWDTKDQMSGVSDVAGGMVSVSIGGILKRGVDFLTAMGGKIGKLIKGEKPQIIKKGAMHEMAGAAAATEESTLHLNLPSKFDWVALQKAFKHGNNFRFGGIYNDLDTIQENMFPNYFVFSFDLAGSDRTDVFGNDGDETTDEVKEALDPKTNKGPPLKVSAYGLVPIASLTKVFFKGIGIDNMSELMNSAKAQVPTP